VDTVTGEDTVPEFQLPTVLRAELVDSAGSQYLRGCRFLGDELLAVTNDSLEGTCQLTDQVLRLDCLNLSSPLKHLQNSHQLRQLSSNPSRTRRVGEFEVKFNT
jgi:hypothetical protein